MSKLSGTVCRNAFVAFIAWKGMWSEKWENSEKSHLKGSLCSVELARRKTSLTSASLAHFLLEQWVTWEEMSCGIRLHLCISSRLAASDGRHPCCRWGSPSRRGKRIGTPCVAKRRGWGGGVQLYFSDTHEFTRRGEEQRHSCIWVTVPLSVTNARRRTPNLVVRSRHAHRLHAPCLS